MVQKLMRDVLIPDIVVRKMEEAFEEVFKDSESYSCDVKSKNIIKESDIKK